MELESFEYKIVVEDGRDTEVARAASATSTWATATYLAARAGTQTGPSHCTEAPASSNATTAAETAAAARSERTQLVGALHRREAD